MKRHSRPAAYMASFNRIEVCEQWSAESASQQQRIASFNAFDQSFGAASATQSDPDIAVLIDAGDRQKPAAGMEPEVVAARKQTTASSRDGVRYHTLHRTTQFCR